MNILLSPDGKYALISDMGFDQSLTAINASTGGFASNIEYPNCRLLPLSRTTNGLYYGGPCAMLKMEVSNVAARRPNRQNFAPERRPSECMGDSPFAAVRAASGAAWLNSTGLSLTSLCPVTAS